MERKRQYSKLKIIREYYNMSELKLANEAGCTANDIVAIEEGNVVLENIEDLKRMISDVLFCYPEDVTLRTGESGKNKLLEKLPKRDTLMYFLKKNGIDLNKHGACQEADTLFGFDNQFTSKTIRLKHPMSEEDTETVCDKLGITVDAFGLPFQMEIQETEEGNDSECFTAILKADDPNEWIKLDDEIINAINAPRKFGRYHCNVGEARDLLMGTRVRTETDKVFSSGVVVHSWWDILEDAGKADDCKEIPTYGHYIDYDYEQVKYWRDVLDVLVKKKEEKRRSNNGIH